jgi:hypothetical protein
MFKEEQLMSILTCGALSRSTGKPCLNVAGKGTDHVGEGRCRLHGGASPIKHGLYSKVRRTRLGQRMAEIENDPDLMNLVRELALLKALAEQVVQHYQKHEAALLAWHRAESPVYQKLIETHDPSQIRDAVVELRGIEPQRPAELPDAKIIATLVAEIGRTQDRIRDAETVCTRRQLVQILDRMAGVVSQFADKDTARKIRDGWMSLPVEGIR